MNGMTWGKYYWPYFLILVSNLFIWPELIALLTNDRNTLSDYSWFELHVRTGVSSHTISWYASIIAWLMFVVVITAHIWFRKLA